MSDRLNLIDTIAKQDNLSTFSRIMKTSGTNDLFGDGGSFTVFAPTNDAFAKIPDETLNTLLNEADQKGLKAILSYHILPGKVMAASLKSAKAVTGQEVMITDINGIRINSSVLQARNLEATNGVVHGIDTVLRPPTPYGNKPLL
jgi:uncharacterized surface protein with fasciclin (FAS1) repeats